MITADKANEIKKAVDEGFRLWWKWIRKPPKTEADWNRLAEEFQTAAKSVSTDTGDYEPLVAGILADMLKDVERNIK